MFIKEVVIDGFKSYATRTVISGWDPQFNAITGLNGSGKSNILDAICFVLGITSLAHVRAANLQDLVYKRGQAGIQKASVSIIFDNSDKEKSPPGYTGFSEIVVTRQVVVGGKNKYLVNGHTTQQQVIQNLFQSVQLNVNNPHFLIMQGKITKVLNMRPLEILAMIEEAAGTRMFEERKDKAIKAIARKDAKLTEIQGMLRDEILPRLEKLRSERMAFLEFQKNQHAMERLERDVVLMDYARQHTLVEQSEALTIEQKETIASLEAQREQQIHTLDDLRSQEEALSSRLASDRVHALERQEADLAKALAKADAQLTLKRKAVEEEESRLAKGIQRNEGIATLIEQQQEIKAEKERSLANLVTLHEDQTREIDATQRMIASLTVTSGGGSLAASSFADQLKEEQSLLAKLQLDQGTLKQRIRGAQADLEALEAEATKAHTARSAVEREMQTLEQQIQAKVSAIARGQGEGNPKRLEEAQMALRQCNVEWERSQEERDRLAAQLGPYIDFEYTSPSPNFDRTTVRGTVASLISLSSEHQDKSLALEVAAGARLHNIVVDTEVVGAQLLKHGRLRKRVTLIPLNKIQPYRLSADKVEKARRISNGKAVLALDLIHYDPKLQKAMEYIFGSTFVCEDAKVANQITFHPQIKARSVTLAGDVYDPSGVLSGGSKAQSSGLLTKVVRLREVEDTLHSLRKRIEQLKTDVDGCLQNDRQVTALKDELELLQHQADLLRKRSEKGDVQDVTTRLAAAQRHIAEWTAKLEDTVEREKRTRDKVVTLQHEANDLSKDRDKALNDLKRKLEAATKALDRTNRDVTKLRVAVETCGLEVQQALQDRQDGAARTDALRDAIRALALEVSTLEGQVASLREEHAQVAREVAQGRRERAEADRELGSLHQRRKQLTAAVQTTENSLRGAQHALATLTRDAERAGEALRRLLERHAWLASVQRSELLNASGGGSGQGGNSASRTTMEEAQHAHRRLAELVQRHERLKRNVNLHVMEMIGVAETRETELTQKLQTVLRDKMKIEDTIAKLDEVKEGQLRRTWEKVNVDFGQIFRDLLPGGNMAQLVPVEGARILAGLTVRVRLGNVWKESLGELSGGQRSLIALSLILALLQFKPAPMYILDEVDAALDLSHTQNIGQLIKTRFTNSQFIIVSLKEGMFANAHILFQTKFRDGTSTVERIKGRKK